MKRILLTLLTISFQLAVAQVGIGNSSPKAQLDISASSTASPTGIDGILIPRIDNFPTVNPSAAQNGMLVFLTTTVGTKLPGFYYWSNPASAWVGLSSNDKSWDVSGNGAAVSGTNFIGTTNAQDVDFRTNNIIKMRLSTKGQLEFLNTGGSLFVGEQAGDADDLTNNQNTFIGYQSGMTNVGGYGNSAVGNQSFKNNATGYNNSVFGNLAMQSNVSGHSNAAFGFSALSLNSTGHSNTAFGTRALMNSATAISNTAIGLNSLMNNTANNNTATGANSLQNNTTGYSNMANGTRALQSNIDGYFNTASGYSTLMANTSGKDNTASGASALQSNTTGSDNTATGVTALQNNIDGANNTATGVSALQSNTSGSNNTATGFSALLQNTTGAQNTAMGINSLKKNGGGNFNSALGMNTLATNASGEYNTATGFSSMLSNTVGNMNTASGISSLYYNTEGNNNTGIGGSALRNNTTGDNNSSLGMYAGNINVEGNNNTAVGYLANVSLFNFNNTTAIGNGAVVNASNRFRFGNAAVTLIEGQVAYSNPSDARFKNNIKDNVPGLDFIMKLKPVTYHFDTKKFDEHRMQRMPEDIKAEMRKQDYSESSAIIHTGFLAQDIEKAAQSIGYDFDGLHVPDASNPTDNYSVAYSQFVIPMVKAIQEQQAEIEAVKKENAELKSAAVAQKQLFESLEKRISAMEQKSR